MAKSKDLSDLGKLLFPDQPELHQAKPTNTDSSKPRYDLRVWLDRKKGNKEVTAIAGFGGSDMEAEALCKQLKNHCGAGGSYKDGEILIQGNHRERVKSWLELQGHRVKLAGG